MKKNGRSLGKANPLPTAFESNALNEPFRVLLLFPGAGIRRTELSEITPTIAVIQLLTSHSYLYAVSSAIENNPPSHVDG